MSKLKQLLFSLNETDRRVIEEKLKEKDQQINQLKQQLVETEQKFLEFQEDSIRNEQTYVIELAEKDKEIKKLNWQLKDKDFTIKNLNHSLSVAPNANAGQRARIDELTKIVKEKDKEIEKLKLKLDIRAMSLQNINTERMESERNQTQLAIQELEKLKASADKWFDSWENSKYEGNIYDKLDVSNAYLQMSCEIDQQIKELKGENK